MTQPLTIGSLFSGIGGLELGLEWGIGNAQTLWQVEIDPYARAVLKKHWPGAQRMEDVRNVTGESVPGVDLICGGWPCQPFSVAGKRQGEADERHLWPQFARVVSEVKPRWIVGENVPGLLTIDRGRTFGRILADLAALGFNAEWHVFPAASVGAHHLRNRLFIVAYAPKLFGNGGGNHPTGHREGPRALPESGDGGSPQDVDNAERFRWHTRWPDNGGNDGYFASSAGQDAAYVADALRPGWQEQHAPALVARAGYGSRRTDAPEWAGGDWRQPAPTTVSAVRGMADGFPGAVDRLRCLGNAVVPQAAQVIGRAIQDAERYHAMTGRLPEQIVRPEHLKGDAHAHAAD